MITLYVDSEIATPAVMQRLREYVDSYEDPRFNGAVIEIELDDFTSMDGGDMDAYDLQRFFNGALAITQGAE